MEVAVHRMGVIMTPLLATTVSMLTGCSGAAPEPADLVVRGGRIVTVDADQPEVDALAARGQRIVALGTDAEIAPLIGPKTEVIELDGGLVIPGFVDSHVHFLGLGQSKMVLDLTTAASWQEIVERVAAAARDTPPGEWIRGRGWHQDKWDRAFEPSIREMPVHDELSDVSPDHPVLLVHASGHASIVNASAIELLRITDATPNPPGGEIVRDPAGRATGVLLDTAAERAEVASANRDEASVRRMAELAAAECLAHGVTSVQDAGASFDEVQLMLDMAEHGELGVRLWIMLGERNEVLADGLPGLTVHRAGNGFLTVGGIKRYMDGALGSHTAWLLEPYDDIPDSTGLRVESDEAMHEVARLALDHGLQLCTHAIGDLANRETLDLYQRVVGARDDPSKLRWRIEHAQHLHPDDVHRFAELGVIAAMQPVHATSDGPWVPKRLGDGRSRQGAYAWRTLLDSGAVIAAGTDAPVEAVDPIANFEAAVSRRMPDGSAFYPEQVMTRAEALKAMTLDAAYAAFEDDIKGSLEVGKLADITVLSRDILAVPEGEIGSATVRYTIVGGTIRYAAP
jgi:predicted amidohydrolase YtcJ